MQEDVQGGQNTDQYKTEVSVKTQKLQFKIQHGFWMRGDFFIVLSFDKRNNHYYLEMYRYAQIPNIVDKEFLFESKERLEIQVELNEGRRLASILVEEYNMQTQQFMKNTMYLLNSSEFKVASTQSDTQIYRISAGMQAVTHDELPSRKPIYEYSRLF